MDRLQAQVSEVIIQVIFWSGITAPLVMALFWRWWRTELGWSIVAKTLALSLALLMTVLVIWFGPSALTRSAVLQWFTVAALGAVPVILWWRVWVIYKTQRDGSKHY